MKKLLILPLIIAALALGACDETDDPVPAQTVTPTEIATSVPVVVPSNGTPSVSASPTTTVVPKVTPKNTNCAPHDANCGNGTDKPLDGE